MFNLAETEILIINIVIVAATRFWFRARLDAEQLAPVRGHDKPMPYPTQNCDISGRTLHRSIGLRLMRMNVDRSELLQETDLKMGTRKVLVPRKMSEHQNAQPIIEKNKVLTIPLPPEIGLKMRMINSDLVEGA